MARNSPELCDNSSRKNKRLRASEQRSESVSQTAENQERIRYQRRIWDGMRKRIDALIKKLNPSNIRDIIRELFFNNLLRCRGLLCSSIIKAFLVSPNSIPVLACLVAVINSKLPDIGYLLLKRIIVQFKHAYERGEKTQLSPLAKFLGQMINRGVVNVSLATELLIVLFDEPNEDNVDTAVTFLLECGYCLQIIHPYTVDFAFQTLAEIRKVRRERKSLRLITGLFMIRRDDFLCFQEPKDELDNVIIDDQVTHKISFLNDHDPELSVDSFRVDLEFMENEERYTDLRERFLGESSSSTVPK